MVFFPLWYPGLQELVSYRYSQLIIGLKIMLKKGNMQLHFVVGMADCASQCNGLAYLVTLRAENFNRDKEMMEKKVEDHVKMITTKHKRTKWRLMIRSKIPRSR
ncbi:hypothetical protein Hanom_Chr11g01003761 [Helianthus anomalus]